MTTIEVATYNPDALEQAQALIELAAGADHQSATHNLPAPPRVTQRSYLAAAWNRIEDARRSALT